MKILSNEKNTIHVLNKKWDFQFMHLVMKISSNEKNTIHVLNKKWEKK